MNKELALKLMEEGDDEAELASRKKKGKVGEQIDNKIKLFCVHLCLLGLLNYEL